MEHPDGATATELREEERGGCDAILVVSITKPPGEEQDIRFVSYDGYTEAEMSEVEKFKAWMFLCRELAQSKDLDEGKKLFAAMVWDTFVKSLKPTA